MVESTNLSMLRNLEAFQVYSDVLTFLNGEESMEDPLKKLRDIFAAHLSDYDVSLIPERRSRYTAELARVDGKRDYDLRGFTSDLKLGQSSYDPEQVKAADALLALMDKYGKNIPAMPYRQETAAINNLLQDLDLEANVALAKTLHVEHRITAVRASNKEFEQLMLTRTDVSSESATGPAKELRLIVQFDFEEFCKMLNALCIVNGEAAYKQMCDRINQLVSESRNAVLRRRAHKKASDDKPTDSPTDTPDTPEKPDVEE